MSNLTKQLLMLLLIIAATVKPIVTKRTYFTPSLLSSASQIANQIDSTVDPCVDFFKFVCGKSMKTKQPYKNLEATPLKALGDKIQSQLSEIIQEPIGKEDHYTIRIQKKLFQSCMNETPEMEEESMETFKETLKELKGWPVLMGYKWNRRLFSSTQMISQLREKGYPYWMLLNVGVQYDPLNEEETIIRPPIVQKIQNKEQYTKYMTDVAVKFGADWKLARIEMEKVMDFMEILKRISETKNKEADDSEESTRYTVGEFQEYNDEINWLEFINAMLYPTQNISYEDFVIFPKRQFIKEYFNLIWRVPKRTLANYIIWNVIEQMIPLLSKDLKQLKAQYDCAVATPQPQKDRFEICQTLIAARLMDMPSLITYARRTLPSDERQQVQKLFDDIKSEFINFLNETSWMDNDSKESAFTKLDGLTEVIGAPGNYFDDAILENFFPDTYKHVEADNYLNMLVTLRKYFFDTYSSKIRNKTSLFELISVGGISHTKPSSIYDFNAIIFPVGLLEEIFQPDRPMYLNYGTAGFVMGRELADFLNKYSDFHDDDSNENSIWTNQTNFAYKEAVKCISKEAENFITEEINATLTSEQLIADITGMKVAYAAYKEWIEENGEELSLPGLQHTPDQLFWISAMSYQCFKLNDKELQDTLENNILNVYQTAVPMRHNHDFAEDFNCPANSKMNPGEKCKVF